MAHQLNPYRRTARRHVIAEHYLAGDPANWTYRQLRPKIDTGEMVFSRNIGGRRVAESQRRQYTMLQRTIESTFKQLGRDPRARDERRMAYQSNRDELEPISVARPPWQDEVQKNISTTQKELSRLINEMKDEEQTAGAAVSAERRVEAMTAHYNEAKIPVKKKIEERRSGPPTDNFLETIWRAREVVRRTNEKSAAGGAIPDVGTRAIVNAAQAYKVGVPFEASLHALGMDWTDEIRKEIAVQPFDPQDISMPDDPNMPPPTTNGRINAGTHSIMPALVRLAHARVPIALIGPAGSGKTEAARQLAEILGLEFSMLPMSGGITRGDICGTETMSGFKSRPFPHIYEHGGVFLADEFDAANPRVLPILNAALANSHWKNPMTDAPPIKRHENFVFVAAMNTTGRGADRQFTARERLDQATLDRFAIGRVVMDYDQKLEQRIFDTIMAAK